LPHSNPLPLTHRWLARAIVSPFRRPIHPAFAGGLELADDADLAPLRHHRTRRPVDRRLDDRNLSPPRLMGSYLYGGPLILEFGHFLSESIHRLLPGRALAPELPILFAGPRGSEPLSLQVAYVQQVLQFLGVPPERVHVTHHAVEVDRLLVIEQGSDLGGGPKAAYLDLLDRFSPERLDQLAPGRPAPERVYVSRSRMPAGLLLGEHYLEGLLAEAGFAIYRPEEHALVDQMHVYRHAHQLIFSEGSACHGTELMGRQLRQVALLNRRPAPKPAMFRAALKPRARHYADFQGNRFVGALPIGPARRPLAHAGVSLIEIDGLLDFLAAEGLAELRGRFDRAAYADAARRDFDRHVAWALAHPRTNPDDVRAATPPLQQQVEQALSG